MQRKVLWIVLVLVLTSCLQMKAQGTKKDVNRKKWFIGSTLLEFGNFAKTNNPEYILLNLGYRITPKDAVSLRFERYVYAAPKAIPLGSSINAAELNYSGHVRIIAPQIGYQRFWWKGAYTAVYVSNGLEKYLDKENKKIGNGYTLYLDFYLGYQFRFFKNRFFFEPAIGCSYWPLRTNVPQHFKSAESKWPNYFIQPGLDFGFNF